MFPGLLYDTVVDITGLQLLDLKENVLCTNLMGPNYEEKFRFVVIYSLFNNCYSYRLLFYYF